MNHLDPFLKKAAEILRQKTSLLDQKELEKFVSSFIDRKDTFLNLARKQGSPLYIIDKGMIRERTRQFLAAFRKVLPESKVYYAIKSNNHPVIAAAMVEAGLGLDVSSGIELKLALDSGAKDIVFSGPAKLDDELVLACEHNDRVTMLIDSFRERERLNEIAKKQDVSIRAGVRLTVDERGLWRKFGIALNDLPRFFADSDKYSHIRLCGLQFHTSWNLDSENQIIFIQRLGDCLKSMDKSLRAKIEFIDIGGGYWPPYGEWLQAAGTTEGKLHQVLATVPEPFLNHYHLPAIPIAKFAEDIAGAVRKHILPYVNCHFCMEPGRWLCHDAMHILLTVIDKKGEDIVITDAGTNTIGWERFETDYFPVINLSQPALTEKTSYVLGSLCTPHDVWGYAYFGKSIERGDVLLIPTQGAYTYSLRQDFIKSLPKTAVLEG